MTRCRTFSISVLLLLLLSLPAWSALIEFQHFDRDLAKQGVQATYTAEGMTALIGLVRHEIEAARTAAAAADDKDRKKLERMADAADEALEALAARAGSATMADRHSAFPALKSLLYSFRSEVQGPMKRGMLGVVAGLLGNLSLSLPYLSPEERERPLTEARAQREAMNLFDPEAGRAYAVPAELAGLSPARVSRLDVRTDNPAWHTGKELEELKARHGTAWKAFEARIEARVSEAIDAPYRLDRARRVLFFDEIKSSGTSAKVQAEDVDGQEWTVKWGDEVHTEPLATRLYVELGAEFADWVQASRGGRAELVLVLDREDAEDETCGDIATLDRLQSCLAASKYEFDVSPYVAAHGEITEELLREEPFVSAKAEAKKLLGRQFVTFNEALVAFEPPSEELLLLGAVPMSSGGALDDRAKRGLVVFTYWIHNKDAKDINNKGLIDRDTASYGEFMHDLGASLGSLKNAGSPNQLKVGDGFVHRRGSSIRFSNNMLYLPKAFERATYADAVWMARKIVELPREVILDAIAATAWPDFQQQAMASRLIARRNGIASAFDVGSSMDYDASPTRVSLRTPEDRLAAVRRYRLAAVTDTDEAEALATLEALMAASGIEISDGRADWEDEVTTASKHGVLQTRSCKKSVIVALLESTIHPAGLSRRVHRRNDEEPLKACHPN